MAELGFKDDPPPHQRLGSVKDVATVMPCIRGSNPERVRVCMCGGERDRCSPENVFMSSL